MDHRMLENALKKKLLWRRIILGIIVVIFLIFGIICSSLYETTKEVVTHKYDTSIGILEMEETVYNDSYVPFIVIGFWGSFASFVFLLSDFLFCRFDTVEMNGYYLTVYRGMFGHYVYVDGEEKDRLTMYGHYIEITLPDGTVVTFAFGRGWMNWCHISFSNGYPSIDL